MLFINLKNKLLIHCVKHSRLSTRESTINRNEISRFTKSDIVASALVNILLNPPPSFCYEIDLRINPYTVFIYSLWHRHADESRCFKCELNFVVVVNTILKQEEINITFKVNK